MKKNDSHIINFPHVEDIRTGICKHDFDVIYADPPWEIGQKGNYGAINHYDLMPLDRIKQLPVASFCKENAACFLWVTNALLREGLDVLKAWGFTYRGPFYWVKTQLGLGQYFRNASETLLLGTKGRMPVEFRAQPNWAFMPRQEHSHKPEEMYAIIERLYPQRDYLELFCRKRPSNLGWYIWGLEAEGGSDVVIPGYPVTVYSDRVSFLPPDGDPAAAALKEAA
jgi:Transcriptional activator, adenine-specific DNA methyltransferase